MNIDKQDERLLHEILSKYKQGLISGLIQGNNVTFTSTGCRNKVISSTGGGTSSLFPNGYTFIAEDYEIKASDEGKIIYSIIGTPVNVTMPASVIFTGGMNIGLLLINGGTFQRTSNDAPIEVLPYIGGTVLDTINNKAGEFLLFQTVAIGVGGNSQLQLISTSVLEDNGVLKTTLKYLYDKSQNAIPLSGTEVGKPVTGDIDFANANIIFNNIDGDKFIKFGFNTATDETGLYFDNGLDPQTRFSIYNGDIQCYMPIGSYFSFANDYLGFSKNGNSSFVGIRGGEDYSNIITDLDYTQKIYVDNIAGKIITLGTITYEDLNNTGIGENNVIIPLDFQNVPTDYYIECFYYDVSEAFDKAMSNDAEITTQDPSLTSTINIDSLSRTVKRTTSTIFPAGVESTGDTFTIHLTDANNGTSTAGSVTIKALVKKFPN